MDEKDKNELKRYIQNWKVSRKYSEFRKQIDEKSKDLLNLYFLPKEKIFDYISQNQIKKSELEKMVDSIIEFSEMSEEEKSNLNWIIEEFVVVSNKQQVYKKLIQSLLTWYTYIFIYEKAEDYEFCSKLLKICDFEIKECINALRLRIDFEESDEMIVEEINKVIKNKILVK